MLNRASRLIRVFKYSTAPKKEGGPPPNLAANFKRFQIDDGIPVYLKGGRKDHYLLQFTIILLVIGLIDSFHTIYEMAKPKKK